MLFGTTWVASRDTSFWNQGRFDPTSGQSSHPIDEFWAERFLEFDGEELSGPVQNEFNKSFSKPNLASSKRSGTATGPRDATKPQDAGRYSNAKVAESGLQGYYFPFGGGSKMCPGRFFAKQQIMVTVALMLRTFDMELLDPGAAANSLAPSGCDLPRATDHGVCQP